MQPLLPALLLKPEQIETSQLHQTGVVVAASVFEVFEAERPKAGRNAEPRGGGQEPVRFRVPTNPGPKRIAG